MTTETRPVSPHPLDVLYALDVAAAQCRLHIRSRVATEPAPARPGDEVAPLLYVTVHVVGLDRRTPATAPDVQQLLRKTGAAWGDMEPEQTDRGRRWWRATLTGQRIHLTVVTDVAVPVQGSHR